jgi:hypothetical protein
MKGLKRTYKNLSFIDFHRFSVSGQGLLCEYAYVIDLDKNILEIYIGGGTVTENERFYYLGENAITLFRKFQFIDLNDKTMDELNDGANEETDIESNT